MHNEQELIAKLTKGFQRSSLQLNSCHESDAELVRLSPNGPIVAITTDSIVEEITSGLYDDYYLIGWMAVMVNVSDLAAVGAAPTGVVISHGIPEIGLSENAIEQIQKGIFDASQTCQIPLLGGDTNTSPFLTMTGTALGWIPHGLPMTRIGCKTGDVVALTGKAGIGNLFAYQKLFEGAVNLSYLPKGRIVEGQILRNFASACMDTSDGIFNTMNEIGRLNQVGFHITAPLSDMLISHNLPSSLPAWILLAGIHGEFELLCTIPREKWSQAKNALPLIEVGEITSKLGIQCHSHYFAPGAISDCWNESKNTKHYLNNLIKLETLCQL